MIEDPSPVPPELKALFDAERKAGPMPAASRQGLWARLEAGLPPPPRGGAPSAGHGVMGSALAKHVITAGISLAIGGAGGMTLQAHLSPQKTPPVPALAAATRAPPAPAPAEAAALPAPTPPKTPVATRPQLQAPRSAEPRAEGALDRERILIDTARTALTRGDAPSALELLTRHARDFPAGELVEEAEALRIQALVRMGQMPEARAAADRFRVRYPRSLLLSAIEESVGPP